MKTSFRLAAALLALGIILLAAIAWWPTTQEPALLPQQAQASTEGPAPGLSGPAPAAHTEDPTSASGTAAFEANGNSATQQPGPSGTLEPPQSRPTGSPGTPAAGNSLSYTVQDGGLARDFVLALDEVWVTDADGKGRTVAVNASSPEDLERILQSVSRSNQAAQAVLYPNGVERSEFTRRTVAPFVTVQLAGGSDPAAVARAVGAASYELPDYAPGFVVLRTGPGLESLRSARQLAGQPGVLLAEAQLARQQAKRAMPNDSLINQQWHLKFNNQSGAVAGTDVNVEPAWGYPGTGGTRGTGIRVGIVDDGLQTAHPDLAVNVDTVNDKDWNGNDSDPNPGTGDDHGTACAGNVAARGNNNLGVAGTAPEATLVGMRLISAAATDSQEAEAMGYLPQLIQIKSNSWGPNDDARTLEGPGTLCAAALKTAAETGRGGRGTIFTWAGGNGGSATAVADNSNYDGYANSIYTIAVGAFDSQSKRSYYSEPGANLVVTAPSSGSSPALGITTVDRTGTSGYNTSSTAAGGDYTNDFGGTSSATPTVSGIVALMLQANPNLGWRDVQEILMRSARKVNPSDADWKTPVAPANINHNHNFGAGLVDAAAAVEMSKTWVNLGTQRTAVSTQSGLSVSIPDNNAAGVTRTFDFSSNNLRVEHVTVKLSVSTVRKGQLEITLTSPSGTVSKLAERHSDTTNLYTGWTFMTVRNWGENSQGVWTLKVADRTAGTTGTLTAAEVTIYGTDGVPVNPAPAVTLTAPVSGSYTTSGGTVALTATAADSTASGSTGVVSSVQFFQGSTLLGTGSLQGGNYVFNWVNPAPATYTLTARATDSEGVVGISAPVVFTVLSGNGSPVISSLNPAAAPVGSAVVVTGSNFVEVSSVLFNGLPAASFNVDSPTQLTAMVPVGAASGLLTVANTFGSGVSSAAFTVTEAPVLISQVYGAGGNTGATYNSDYVELHNRSSGTVNLTGWSLQYASATGTSWQSAPLSGSIAPGKYFLIRLSSGAIGAPLPTPDLTPSTGINMGGTSGKVALMNTATVLSGASPLGVGGLQDFVGYGTAGAFEGSGAAPSPSSTTAIFRAGSGATDTGDNAADFSLSTPNPRNSLFGGGSAPVISSPLSTSGTVGQAFTYQISASNTPTSFGATGLPTGLSVNTATGLISGTPSVAGSYNVSISATNASGSDSKTLVLTVNPSGGGGLVTIFSENMGTPGGTTAIAAYALGTAPATFQNKGTLTFGQGDQTSPADVRSTTVSSGYTGASGGGNVWFTTTAGNYGFSIEGINASGHTSLSLAYGYYKNSGTAHATFSVDYWNGSAWVTLASTAAGLFNEGATAATGWYAAKELSLPAAAQINGLKIRFVKSGSLGIRIDDVRLTGQSASSPTITTSGSLSAVHSIYGSPSPLPSSFTLTATNLTAGVLITPPPGFEVSQTAGGGSGYAASQTVGGAGSITSTAIFVRLAAGTTAGSYSGQIVCSSPGAASANVAVPPSEVRPKGLSITADHQTKPFGQSLSLGAGQTAFSTSGLVAGESVESVTLAASGGTGANDAAGSYTLIPSAATGGTFNPANYDISYQPGTLTVTGQPYASWSSGLSDPAPGADPDRDGLTNLAEYFMSLDAAKFAQGPTSNFAGGVLALQYRRNKTAEGVTGTVKWSASLSGSWSSSGVTDEVVSDHGTYEIRRASIIVPPQDPRRFLRLEVTAP